jgi:class 3 adenylate cyclase
MLNEQVLEERLAKLEAARTWSPRVVSRLEALLRSEAEEAVFRVNPIQFGSEKGIAEAEAVDLFLHATLAGLVEMDWALVCPLCSDVVESFRSLNTLHNHFHCTMCHADYEAALDDCIMVTFSVSPAVRRIRFHDPDSLSAWDYAVIYRGTPVGVTPEGLPWFEVIKASLRGVARLKPGETVELVVNARPGALIGFDMMSDASFGFVVSGETAAAPQRVPIVIDGGAWNPIEGTLATGSAVFALANQSNRPSVFGILEAPPELAQRGVSLKFAPHLSGSRLLATQTFRDFFRAEIIRATEGIAVREITLLFTDLKGSTALYERIGDLNAYMLVQRHFEELQAVTVKHHGAVTKTIGDAVMAAFLNPADAVRAALEMRDAIERLNEDRAQRDFVLKIGLHRGAAIAVTLNERLDYFGQTVNIAARVQNLAGGDEICMTEEVRSAPGVDGILSSRSVQRSQAELKGVAGAVPVYRV